MTLEPTAATSLNNGAVLRLRIEILLLSLLVLCLAQGFSALLGTFSFRQEYRQTFLSGNRSVASEFPEKIEKALRFGKQIGNFYGMDSLMDSIHQANPTFEILEVYLPDGSIAYSLNPARQNLKVPEDWLQAELAEGPGEKPVLLYPIHDAKGERVGTAGVILDDGILHREVRAHLFAQVRMTLGVLAVAALLLILCLKFLVPLEAGSGFPKKRLLAVVMGITLLSQVVLIGLGTLSMREVYLRVVREDVGKVTAQLQRDLESLINKGLSIDKLFNVEPMLNSVMETSPAIAAMQITDAGQAPLYRVERASPLAFNEHLLGRFLVEQTIEVSLPVHGRNDRGEEVKEGYIQTWVSGEFLQARVEEFLLNASTVMLVSLLFITELILFFLLWARQKYAAGPLAADGGGQNFIRTAISVFLFGYMMTVSFVPLRMQGLVEQAGNSLPPAVLSSLPVSAEMFCSLLAVLLAGAWSDRRGWHFPFLAGVLLSALACWFSGITADPWWFVASRGLAGIGYGLTWMSAQSFVFANTRVEMRARSLASLAAGVMSGYLCGNVIGAMLAEQIGFSRVFLVASGFILLGMLPALFFMRGYMIRPRREVGNTRACGAPKLWWKFFTDRKVLLVLVCCVLPLAICQVGLIAYAAPVLLKSKDVSQANIGRAIMFFGLTLVYVGPFVSRYIDGPARARQYLVISGLLAGGGLLWFLYVPTVAGFFLAVILTGLACSFGLSAQTVVVQSLPRASELGSGVAVSMERVTSKLGQMLGPVLMGLLFAKMPMAEGLGWIGGGFVLLTLLFALLQGVFAPEKDRQLMADAKGGAVD